MKNLFVCCDGTWCSPSVRQDGVAVTSNVHRFYSALAERNEVGEEQARYYHPGIGTEGGTLRRMLDGTTGTGLSRHIKSALMWLSRHYLPGDRLYLIGFSRGAYTVRSLGGLLTRFSIPVADSGWDGVEALYEAYRRHCRDEVASTPALSTQPCSIHFLGVWDTVGSLGIPQRLQNLPKLVTRRVAERNSFHDTHLSPKVLHAFQALAIDEMREDFQPTLWTGEVAPGQQVEQVYFAGVHADVGGGYRERGLSDITLGWMIDKARLCGAAFRADMLEQIPSLARQHQDVLHDSHTGVFELTQFLPRAVPWLEQVEPVLADGIHVAVHDSVHKRIQFPPIAQSPYWQARVLAIGETSAPLQVFARDRWNFSGLFLEQGRYRFSAQGEWLDLQYICGPQGQDSGLVRRVAASTKRVAGARWMELIGCVANAQHVPSEPDHARVFRDKESPKLIHQHFPAWDEHRFEQVERPGYLYFFANDAWMMYGNNAGHVWVTVTRLE